MYAIIVKFLSPTNTKGSRLKATAAPGVTHIQQYDHALNWHRNAEAVARLALAKYCGKEKATAIGLDVWDSPGGGWVVVHNGKVSPE